MINYIQKDIKKYKNWEPLIQLYVLIASVVVKRKKKLEKMLKDMRMFERELNISYFSFKNIM